MTLKRVVILVVTIAVLGGVLFYLYDFSRKTSEVPYVFPEVPLLSPTPPPQPLLPPPPPPGGLDLPPPVDAPTSTPNAIPAPFPSLTPPLPLAPLPAAEGAVLSLFPAAYSGEVGKTYSVDVVVNTAGQNVVAASVVVQYDDSRLGFSGIGAEDSVFPIEVERLNYPGMLQLSRGKVAPGFKGDQGFFARLDFTPKLKGVGEVKIIWEGKEEGPSRVVVDDGKSTDILGAVSGAKFTIF